MGEATAPPAAAAPASPAAPATNPLRINSLTLCDFRAFPGPEPITIRLDGKHLLVHGENGAGKSSIFHALDQFFSVSERNAEARKQRLRSLKNVFSAAPEQDLKVTVEFDDGKAAATWSIAGHPVDPETTNADARVVNAAYRKAILDYRSLLETNYRHGKSGVNLFEVCINVLLRDYLVDHGGTERRLFDLWAELLRLLDLEARGRKRLRENEKADVLTLLPSINAGLRNALALLQPRIEPLLKELGWDDLQVISFNVPGLTYSDKAAVPPLQRIETKEIGLTLNFRGHQVDRPQTFLNEARLSALALAIYLAGRLVCADTLQADTPRLMVLDDVLIGLDQSNRMPVLSVLVTHFKDWQVILLTHDRVWFEIARAYHRQHKADKFWTYARIHSTDDPSQAPTVTEVGSSAASETLDQARLFLRDGHINAAGNYARIANELALREFCEIKKVVIAYKQEPDKTPASDLLTAAKSHSKSKCGGVYDAPLEAIEMYSTILFNKLSHGGIPTVTNFEVQGAINAVGALLFAVKVVPTQPK